MLTHPCRPGLRMLVAVLFAVALLFPANAALGPPRPVRADDLADQIAASRARQQELLGSITRQKDLIGQLRADESVVDLALESSASALDTINVDQRQIRSEIQEAADALARVEERRDTLVGELRELDWRLDLLETEIVQSEADLAELRRQLGERLADAYRTSQTSLLEQILDASSFTEVLTGVDAHLRFGEQDAELAAQIQADQTELDGLRRLTAATRYNTDQLRLETLDVEADLRARQDVLAATRARLAEMEAETLRLQNAQQQEFERINFDEADAQTRLADESSAEEALATNIDALVAEAERRAAERLRRERERQAQAREEARKRAQEQEQAEAEGSGFMNWPVAGTVTQEFGCTGFAWEPRRGSCAHFHDGIDISGADGTPIRAAASGIVAFVGYNPYQSGGDRAWIVILGHGGGYSSYYGHLQARYAQGVRRGGRVRQGQVIGFMGNTGYSTGTHLHWEVRRGGSPANPRSQV